VVLGFRITHRTHRGSVLPRIATSPAPAGGVRLRLSPLSIAEIFMLVTMPLIILVLIFLLLSGEDRRPWELVGGIVSATAGFFVMLAYYDALNVDSLRSRREIGGGRGNLAWDAVLAER
jgi:hypothetical protein